MRGQHSIVSSFSKRCKNARKTGSESLSYYCRLTALLRVLVLRIWFSSFVCLLLCWFRSNSLSKVSFLFITIISLRIIFDLVENMDPHSLNAHRDLFFQCLMLLLGSAVLMSIHKTDRVEYKVKVRMVCILMDRIDALISLTNFICDHRSDHIGLVRSDKLAAMDGHYKVPNSDSCKLNNLDLFVKMPKPLLRTAFGHV